MQKEGLYFLNRKAWSVRVKVWINPRYQTTTTLKQIHLSYLFGTDTTLLPGSSLSAENQAEFSVCKIKIFYIHNDLC